MQFSILWWLTGNPLAAAVLLLLGYAVADWFSFGFLRGIGHALRNLRLSSWSWSRHSLIQLFKSDSQTSGSGWTVSQAAS